MKLGICQLLVEGGEPERNLERAKKYIEMAAENGCDLALLPETLDLAWTHPSAFQEAEEIPGTRSRFFCELAKKNNIWLCLGLTEKEDSKRFNTAILINRNGELVYKYRKINLLEVEFPYYSIGKNLAVVETEFGKIGINICADNYKQSLCIGHTLARMEAQIILSPSSWTVDYSITEEEDPYQDKWVNPLSEIATLYEIPVVSTTSVGYIVGGPYEGKKMVGCSLFVDKTGKVTQGVFNELSSDIVIADVELGENKHKGVQFGKLLESKGYFKKS